MSDKEDAFGLFHDRVHKEEKISRPARTHKYIDQKVIGDHCNRCDKEVEWFGIPDSLAQACKKCGFVRIWNGRGDGEYEAGATIQEWLEDVYGDKKNK